MTTGKRIAIAVLGISACLFLMLAAARVGFSRLLARYAVIANSIPAADEAVRLSPSDPDTHRARAAVLSRLRMPAEAVKSLELAVSLRYRDDYLWLELGNTREEVDDAQGALAAFDQAVRWAPYYAHTHWQRGNLLLRMRRNDEAFAELRSAVAANKSYLPSLIDLGWGVSREDLKATEQLIEIKDDRDRLALIRFLARKGKGKEVLEQERLLSAPLNSEQKNELARLLIAAKAFRDAFEVWSDASLESPVLNGGFEEPLVLSEAGFGWVLSPDQNRKRFAIDVSEKLAGTKSLQVNLDGNWTPGTPLLSQTFVVEPSKTYHVSFGVKTEDLVTGGPPLLTVSDGANNQLLGKSDSFSSTSSWHTLGFEFTTLATSQAAVIRLQRNNCDPSPCPIFGVFWLDEIRIEQTKPTARP